LRRTLPWIVESKLNKNVLEMRKFKFSRKNFNFLFNKKVSFLIPGLVVTRKELQRIFKEKLNMEK